MERDCRSNLTHQQILVIVELNSLRRIRKDVRDTREGILIR